MSRSDEIPLRWTSRVGPTSRVSDAAVRKGWDDVAGWWLERYTEKGDINREWVIDPALLAIAGDVRGQRILDGGCGNGYLSRILARHGARVVGVDLSHRLVAVAKAYEARDPLGIRFLESDLAKLSTIASRAFDLVISNVVLQDVRRLDAALRELHRVLRSDGRLIFSITHPAFDIPPAHWVREPPDSDRPEERPFIAVDRYFDRVALYWGPSGQPELVGFHRPLRDFTEGLRHAGFVIVRLEEPRPPPEAIQRRYRQFADQLRIPNFLIIEARKA
jgi:SAM-dependent methyltransferase